MPRPLNLILDITERCNLKCVMCYFAAVDRIRFHPMDRELDSRGNMPLEVFEEIAADLFPRAHRVALACAAEPLIHPRFDEIVTLAGRHRVPDLWFPTNLIPLTEKKAEAIVRGGVRVVGVSIDGFTKESYERIRVGARWELLLERLELLRRVRERLRSRRPELRFIFTWMRSNREQLQRLPEFAAAHGAAEVDVRYVSPTEQVDNRDELLSNEPTDELNAELRRVAEELVRQRVRLASYPEFDLDADKPRSLLARARRRLWHLKAGRDRWEYRAHRIRERLHGCAYPGRTYVIRPNGAVFPCQYWEREPIALYPSQTLATLSRSPLLLDIQKGLRAGEPIGTCRICTERRDALYRPFHNRLRVLSNP